LRESQKIRFAGIKPVRKGDDKRNLLQFYSKEEKVHQIIVQVWLISLQITCQNGVNKKKSYALFS